MIAAATSMQFTKCWTMDSRRLRMVGDYVWSGIFGDRRLWIGRTLQTAQWTLLYVGHYRWLDTMDDRTLLVTGDYGWSDTKGGQALWITRVYGWPHTRSKYILVLFAKRYSHHILNNSTSKIDKPRCGISDVSRILSYYYS